MKIVKSFRVFNKILRKYRKRNAVKRIDYIRGKRFVSYWEEKDWVGFYIKDIDQLTDRISDEIRLCVGADVTKSVDIEEYLRVKPNVWLKGEDDGKSFEGFMLTNRDAYAVLTNNQKETLLYPIYRLINCKNNIYPSC